MPAGRPKIKLTDLPKDWEEKALGLMKVGASKFEVMAEIDISQDTFQRLCDEEPEFSVVIKRGEILCRAWWERKGREGLDAKSFQTGLWSMNMKNRFDWVFERKDQEAIKNESKAGLAAIAAALEKRDG